MKWIITLFLLSSACDNPNYVIDDYAPYNRWTNEVYY